MTRRSSALTAAQWNWKSLQVLGMLLMLLALASAACGGSTEQSGEAYDPVITPEDFIARGEADNQYFPLKPGTRFVYEKQTEEGVERTEVEVTRQARTILGVTTIVVRDQVSLDGVLIEDTFDWYAQDKDGNVWYMGEDTKEYENGVVVSTKGSWEAGVDGAKPGIVMRGNSRVGDSYRQEYYAGEAEDMAEVVKLGESASVAYGSFDSLLVTKEWTPLEPGVEEYKYYAPGIGLVLEQVVKGGSGRTELVAISNE